MQPCRSRSGFQLRQVTAHPLFLTCQLSDSYPVFPLLLPFRSRLIDRPQAQDVISNLFDDFVELSGDGRVGRDVCIRGGLASFAGRACMVMGTFKGIAFTSEITKTYIHICCPF